MKYHIINSPVKHIVVKSKKKLHGWYPGKRECTSERMLINPYNGCSVNCFFCYARAFPGYFSLFHYGSPIDVSIKPGTIFVTDNFDNEIAKQLDSLNIAFCGYLSPVTDPFQKVNDKYKYSQKIIEVFIQRNVPVEFITKCKVPYEVIEMIKTNRYSFGQISIITDNEKIRKVLSPGGADTETLFKNINLLARNNIHSVCRIDPILPYINDDKKILKSIIKRAVDEGAKHIVASILDIPPRIKNYIIERIANIFGNDIKEKYIKLYSENITYLNADINYRKKIFDFLRQECDRVNVTFALCMEYIIEDNGNITGLNKQYMSSINCEGINIPVHRRKGKLFYPACDCNGNCLNCNEAICGIDDLAMAKSKKTSFNFSDYKKWR